MFSWPRLRDADPLLRCEMASTGEVIFKILFIYIAVLCCISPAGVIGLAMKKTQPITWKKGPWSFVCLLLHRVITLRKICHQNMGFQVTENPYI